ncbi:phasin family protein [Sphingomonas baiyangensis]|uniref:Phasin family protein n=2 Tax=Sphingomonas baiyangensis TaxID=2572576 RepID=A0A4V5PV16_9SPHN|nr:phasin family protein [Sphingomonas baiyangensis]
MVSPVAVQAAETVREATEAVVEQTVAATENTKKAAVEAAQTVQKETASMQTEMKNAAETMTENMAGKGQAMFADMNDRAKSAMEKNARIVEEMNDLAKGNIEAMVESSRIAAKGMESLGQEAAEYSRKSFEQASTTMKTMAQVKSPTELFKLQSDYFRSAFDMYVAEASKATEHMLKLAGDAAQPLSNRMAVAAEKVKMVA